MTARNILLWPNKLLFQESSRVEVFDEEVLQVMHDLYDTVRVNYGAGLAAPQIGVHKQVCVISESYAPSLEKDPMFNGFVVLVNPELTPVGEEKFAWKEACLSVKDVSAVVKRDKKIELKYQNSQGHLKTVEVTNEESATIQHETDHLAGKLFIHRLEGFSKLSVMKKLKKKIREKKRLARSKKSEDEPKIGRPKRIRKKKNKQFGRRKKK